MWGLCRKGVGVGIFRLAVHPSLEAPLPLPAAEGRKTPTPTPFLNITAAANINFMIFQTAAIEILVWGEAFRDLLPPGAAESPTDGSTRVAKGFAPHKNREKPL